MDRSVVRVFMALIRLDLIRRLDLIHQSSWFRASQLWAWSVAVLFGAHGAVGCGGSEAGEICARLIETSCRCADGAPGVVEVCDGVERTACVCEGVADAGISGDGDGGGGRSQVDGAVDAAGPEGPGRPCLGDGQGACAIVGVAAGRGHTCVWREGGEIDCFGDNTSLQLGRISAGTRDRSDELEGEGSSSGDVQPVEGIVGDVAEVAAGLDYACARTKQGEVWCWGGQADQAGLPSRVLGITDATDLVVGRGHACVITKSHGASCWGDNSAGQLGLGADLAAKTFLPQPKRVRIVEDLDAIALGRGFSCGLVEGRVSCWGQGDRGQLGDGRAHPEPSRVAVSVVFPRDVKVRSMVAGEAHVCALVEHGAVWCWGENTQGQLGLDSSIAMRAAPTVVLETRTQEPLIVDRSLTAGADHTCAADRTGSVYCWGAARALCGEDPAKPVPARAFHWYGVSARQVVAGDHHTCALRRDGRVHCHGANDMGQSMPTELGEVCEHEEPVSVVP
ncbi:MAG: hypothetical protein IPK13_17460 [Deltaproteobacteria bacterium]|nr:hypothetical protein [Deltaproteobacteria bacterium]